MNKKKLKFLFLLFCIAYIPAALGQVSSSNLSSANTEVLQKRTATREAVKECATSKDKVRMNECLSTSLANQSKAKKRLNNRAK